MKNLFLIPLAATMLALTSLPGLAQNACYADYKAKRTSLAAGQLELHYGVARVDAGICGDLSAVADDVAGRIAVDDWTLLRILSTFSEDKLEAKRSDAADYYLRY